MTYAYNDKRLISSLSGMALHDPMSFKMLSLIIIESVSDAPIYFILSRIKYMNGQNKLVFIINRAMPIQTLAGAF